MGHSYIRSDVFIFLFFLHARYPQKQEMIDEVLSSSSCYVWVLKSLLFFTSVLGEIQGKTT